MSARFAPKVERLLDALQAGLGNEQGDVRAELGLKGESDDRDVARSLVQILSACGTASLGEPQEELVDDDDISSGATTLGESTHRDSSLLGQLGAEGADAIRVEASDDVETLLALLRAGRLQQRRAALQRLLKLLDAKSLASDATKRVQAALVEVRDVELDYELAAAREHLPGAPGRQARAEREEWTKAVAELPDAIAEFWEAAEPTEPVSELPGESRAQILMRTRDLPPAIVSHLGALVESGEDSSERHQLLTSLRYAGDPRLVPALINVLKTADPNLATEAARALRTTQDPRVRAALEARYERAVHDTLRAVVGGALAEHGDVRGLEYARQLLEREDPEVLQSALEALESLGDVSDTEAVARLLDHDDPALVRQVVRTLARVGDGRAFKPLHGLASRARSSALRAELEDTHAAVRARLDLRGEEAPADESAAIEVDEAPEPAKGGRRIAAWWSFFWGQVWLAFGAFERGLARLERAASLRPGWPSPFLAIGLASQRKGMHAHALGAFRRAIEADRRRVERNPLFARAVARCFLARAEQVEREGRNDVARGLVNEALGLDLRRASGALRFELERRRDAFRKGASRRLGGATS